MIAIPQVCVKRLENRDGCLVFTALIQSIPAAYHAQWKVKGKDGDTFKPVDVNAKEYKGTSNSLPHPVLIVEQKEEIQKQHFYIQVDNFVGSSKTEISSMKKSFCKDFWTCIFKKKIYLSWWVLSMCFFYIKKAKCTVLQGKNIYFS